MSNNDVKIKVSLEGDKLVIAGLEGIGEGASEADSKLGSMAKKGLAGAGKALVGFSVAAVAAGAALTAGVVKNYAEYEQNIGGIETMFKSAAGKMEAYANEAYQTAGLSANEYMSQVTSFSASLLQGLGGDTDKAAEVANRAMIDMSDNANKFGTNIGDIQNAYQGFAKQNYTMLDNLKLGYGGTAAEMARLVNESGVLGDTMEVTAQTINDVSYDKIIEAIGVVQDEMGITGTTALEASETISGSVGMMKASFENLLTGLGSADADVATLAGNVITSLQMVVTNITPVIENIGNNIQTLGPKLGEMTGTLVGAITSAIPLVLQAGVSMVGGLVTGITSALPGLIGAIVPGVVGLVQMIVDTLPMLVDAGMKAVIALGQGLVQAIPGLLPAIAFMITGIAEGVLSNLPMLLEVGVALIMALAEGALEAIPVLIEYLPEMITMIVNFITGAVPLILNAGIQLFLALVQAIPTVITQLVAVLPQIITSIITAIVGAVPLLVQAGVQLLTALVGALPQIITTIVAALPLIITSILDAVLGALPVLVEAGIQLFIALIGALPQIITTIVQAIPQIIGSVLNAIVGAIPQLIMAGVQLLVALIANLPQIIGTIVAAIPQIIVGIVGALGNGIGQIVKVGGNIVRGLWEGISGAAGWLFGKISGFVNDVMSNIGSFFGIKSPSTRMRDEIGDNLPSGIGAGVERTEDKALNPIRKLNSKIMDEVDSLKVSASLTTDSNITQTIVPLRATATPNTPQSVEAVLDPSAISSAIADSFAANARGEDNAQVSLSRESINTLASAIVDSIRVQSRQGVSVLG